MTTNLQRPASLCVHLRRLRRRRSFDKNDEREISAGQEGSGIKDKRNEEFLALVNMAKQPEPNNELGGSSMDESSLDPIGGKNSNSFQSLETIPEESRLIPSELVDIAVQQSSIGARLWAHHRHTTRTGVDPLICMAAGTL
ncbi:DNA polymerase III subunit beta [Striga asiatica]|uniref:DNA polymerase III subunit beta n=1 Tax=Striga asiatica TaxID=4170 RepID=A0A5A7QWL6_STRAF|nr:DNA polymerase III subunit beta [Striga asiatica]